ncbi:MAG: peptidylprolyl isomerase [Candidatus Azobacteroides sp.]|nr:peptidylprolyl isomerase [Candidatus Azobacteroides sp.]
MKRFFFLLICLTGFLSQVRLQAQSNVIDEVIWVVGDDAILLSDVENTRLSVEMQGQRFPGDPYCMIPEQLAIQKLFLHQAKLDSVEISDSEVYSGVERQINYVISRLGSQEKLEEYFNKSINAYREELRTNLKEQEAIKKVQQGLIGNVKITPSEVRSFYKRIPEDSLPYISTTVEVEIITMEPTVALEEIDNIKSKLRDYTEQVTSGKMQFSTLARAYSDDKESATRGGELGFRGKAELVPEFAAVAFDLNDPKRVSRIVETEYGYHIIQLIEKRGDRINVRHILIRPRVTKEEIAAATQKLDSVRNDIVAGKFTFEEGATYISYDKDTRNNRGLMVNTMNVNNPNPTPRTGTSRFEMSELPPEIAKAVNTMQVGEISPAFSMINAKNNKEIVAIVKLKSRVEGHKASLSEDFQALKSMVEDEKRDEILNNWIAQKQKETYIRINDNWKNCDFERDGWFQK